MKYLLLLLSTHVFAGSIEVSLSSEQMSKGNFFCTLWKEKEGFPMEKEKSLKLLKGIKGKTGFQCLFENIEPGLYAVATSQDINKNGKFDKNWIGIPKEPWGVSNNARPGMRAPRFDEATFKHAGSVTKISVSLEK